MLDQVRAGKNFDYNEFKSNVWLEIMKRFNRSDEVEYDRQQLQSQYSILKKRYSIFKKLVDKSGFGWDEERQFQQPPLKCGMITLSTILKWASLNKKPCPIMQNCARF